MPLWLPTLSSKEAIIVEHLQGIAVREDGNTVQWFAFCLKCEWKQAMPWKSEAEEALETHECKEPDA